jgi:hypothetical protein
MPTPNTVIPATNVYARSDLMTPAQSFALVDLALVLLVVGILLIQRQILQSFADKITYLVRGVSTRGAYPQGLTVRKSL